MEQNYESSNIFAHTKWNCKYPTVFSTKYRRKVIYGKLRKDIIRYIKESCKYKGEEIIEGHCMIDYIHLLFSISPKYSVSSFRGYLKGKSVMMIFDEYVYLKYKF